MLHSPSTITAPLPLVVSADTGDAEIAGELRYDPSDPFAVTLAMGVDFAEPVVWVFARDLLYAGTQEGSGEGDITIEPADDEHGRWVRITLATDCLATMLAPRDRVVEFLVDTYMRVPTGCELDHVDLDAELSALLS